MRKSRYLSIRITSNINFQSHYYQLWGPLSVVVKQTHFVVKSKTNFHVTLKNVIFNQFKAHFSLETSFIWKNKHFYIRINANINFQSHNDQLCGPLSIVVKQTHFVAKWKTIFQVPLKNVILNQFEIDYMFRISN